MRFLTAFGGRAIRDFGLRRSLGCRAFHAGLALGAIGAGALACQTILSIDGDVTVAPHTVDACGIPVASGACATCVAQSCCGELRACASNAACSPYESCLLACGADYACRARCDSAHPIGQAAEVPALDRCVVANCESACGVSCGMAGSFFGGDAAAACQECVVAHDCANGEACGNNLECQAIERCVASCVAPDCRWTCFDAHDAGLGPFVSLVFGAGTTCGPACAIGTNFTCVGKTAWPFAKQSTADVTLHLLDSSTQLAIADATVNACARSDITCSNVIATTTSDSQGSAKLTVPTATTGTGFTGYFEIHANGYLPILYFLSYPLTQPYSEINVLVTSQSNFENSAALLGIALDPARGQIAPMAQDCFFLGARDVVFTADGVDAQTTERYVAGQGMSATATSTDSSGFAIFYNAPPRSITVHATPKATGVESSRVTLFVRAGAMSMIDALPTPQ